MQDKLVFQNFLHDKLVFQKFKHVVVVQNFKPSVMVRNFESSLSCLTIDLLERALMKIAADLGAAILSILKIQALSKHFAGPEMSYFG